MKKLLLIVLFGSLAIQLVSSQGSRTTWAANPNAGLAVSIANKNEEPVTVKAKIVPAEPTVVPKRKTKKPASASVSNALPSRRFSKPTKSAPTIPSLTTTKRRLSISPSVKTKMDTGRSTNNVQKTVMRSSKETSAKAISAIEPKSKTAKPSGTDKLTQLQGLLEGISHSQLQTLVDLIKAKANEGKPKPTPKPEVLPKPKPIFIPPPPGRKSSRVKAGKGNRQQLIVQNRPNPRLRASAIPIKPPVKQATRPNAQLQAIEKVRARFNQRGTQPPSRPKEQTRQKRPGPQIPKSRPRPKPTQNTIKVHRPKPRQNKTQQPNKTPDMASMANLMQMMMGGGPQMGGAAGGLGGGAMPDIAALLGGGGGATGMEALLGLGGAGGGMPGLGGAGGAGGMGGLEALMGMGGGAGMLGGAGGGEGLGALGAMMAMGGGEGGLGGLGGGLGGMGGMGGLGAMGMGNPLESLMNAAGGPPKKGVGNRPGKPGAGLNNAGGALGAGALGGGGPLTLPAGAAGAMANALNPMGPGRPLILGMDANQVSDLMGGQPGPVPMDIAQKAQAMRQMGHTVDHIVDVLGDELQARRRMGGLGGLAAAMAASGMGGGMNPGAGRGVQNVGRKRGTMG